VFVADASSPQAEPRLAMSARAERADNGVVEFGMAEFRGIRLMVCSRRFRADGVGRGESESAI
jgi:hypothetical protein